jgi:hypothetical protein
MAGGFVALATTIWLIPIVQNAVGWQWTFALLAPGPAIGTVAMLRLRARLESARNAAGKR